MTHDPINSPSHYAEGRQFEPIDVIEDWELNFRLANTVKYISRAGRKKDILEDLRKARWYLDREIQHLEVGQSRIRIYELAHELGLSNREVLEACDSLDINVKAHSSSLCAAAASKIRGFLSNRGVQYDDVLTYYGQTVDEKEAWPPSSVNTEVTDEDWADFWDPQSSLGDDVLWDPSVGPVELSEDEIKGILAKKALDQFEDAEIVATVEKRGFILGIKKDGSTCELGGNGRCV